MGLSIHDDIIVASDIAGPVEVDLAAATSPRFRIVLPRAGAYAPRVGRTHVVPLVLVVDDEADVEVLFRQQFRRDLRSNRFTMEFARSAPSALQRIIDAAVTLPDPLRHQHAGDERS